MDTECQMSTPRDIRVFVNDIKSRGLQSLADDQFHALCRYALINLPSQCEVKGKKCPHCSWKIGNAAKTCRNCKRAVGKRHVPVPPPADLENDCMGPCAQDVTGCAHHVLACGHKFCLDCMRKRVLQGFRTCSMCDRVSIDSTIVQNYVQAVV